MPDPDRTARGHRPHPQCRPRDGRAARRCHRRRHRCQPHRYLHRGPPAQARRQGKPAAEHSDERPPTRTLSHSSAAFRRSSFAACTSSGAVRSGRSRERHSSPGPVKLHLNTACWLKALTRAWRAGSGRAYGASAQSRKFMPSCSPGVAAAWSAVIMAGRVIAEDRAGGHALGVP